MKEEEEECVGRKVMRRQEIERRGRVRRKENNEKALGCKKRKMNM